MGADIPKVLLRLSDDTSTPTIIARTVHVFSSDPLCQRIVVCVPAAWRGAFLREIGAESKVTLVDGGGTRQESVRLGVQKVAELVRAEGRDDAGESVLIHDAARCCISADLIARVVEGVARYGAVTAAVPIPDSLCKVSGSEVSSFVDRENVWAIQTPQGFMLGELRAAHFAAQADGFLALDDASVVSRIRDVQVVEGDRRNIKVTHPYDISLARLFAQVG